MSRNASRDLQSVVSGVGPASVLSDGQSGSSMPAYAGGMGPDFVNDEDLRRHRFRAVTVARLAFFVSNFTVTFSLLVGSALDAYNQLEYNTTYMLLTPNLRHYAAMLAGMAAGSIVLGYCMDRFPVRRMAFVMCGLLFLGSCASFATAGLVLSTHPWFGMMRFVTGFGAGGMYPLAGVLSSASAEPHHRGKELVITFLMQLCGYAMAVVFTDLLLQFMCSATVEDGVDQPCTLAQLVLAYRVLMVVEALMAMFVAYMSNQLRAPRRSTPATEVVVDRRSRATNVCTRHMRELLGLVIPWVCVDAVVYGTSLLGGQELNGLEVYGSSYSIKGFAIKVRGHASQRCAAPLDTNVNSAQNVALLILTSPGYFVALRFIESLGRRRLQLLGFGGLSTCFAVMGVVSAFLPASDQSWRHNQPWLYVCRSIVLCRGSYITLGACLRFPLLLTIPQFFANLGPNTTTFVTAMETTDKSLRGTMFGIASGLGKCGGVAGLLVFRQLASPSINGGASLSFGTAAILGACGGMITLCLTDDLSGEHLQHQGPYLRLLGQQSVRKAVSESASVTATWSIPFEQLHVGRQIAAGAFGRVFLGRYIGSTVAIKELFLSRATQQDVDDFKHEHQLLSSLHHPNIVTYFGASMNHPYYYIVTEYVPHCLEPMLFTDPNPPQMERIEKIARDMAKGLAFLHSRGVVHRDIKPSNVLVDDQGVAKLCDFGMARLTRQSVTFALGTIAYTVRGVWSAWLSDT